MMSQKYRDRDQANAVGPLPAEGQLEPGGVSGIMSMVVEKLNLKTLLTPVFPEQWPYVGDAVGVPGWAQRWPRAL